MPRGFTDREKELIHDTLLAKGRELFISYGLKKTSIADLCREAGIALGSFYTFFSSKEELYFEILEIEEDTMKARLMSELSSLEDQPQKYLKHLLRRSLEMLDEYPLMSHMYLDNNMEFLIRKLPEDKLTRHFSKDHADLMPVLDKWRASGMLRAEKTETITGLLRSLFVLSLHKKEIGEAVFNDTMNLIIELVSEGLTYKED